MGHSSTRVLSFMYLMYVIRNGHIFNPNSQEGGLNSLSNKDNILETYCISSGSKLFDFP